MELKIVPVVILVSIFEFKNLALSQEVQALKSEFSSVVPRA